MAKKEKLPGDIARIMNKVGRQQVKVDIKGKSYTMTREKYGALMKSELFYGEAAGRSQGIPGFYLVDSKHHVCKLVMPLELQHADLKVVINERTFRVTTMWRGYTYES